VAETSVREVVGKMKMDAALAEERDQIAPRVRALMQTILDRYKIGVEVVGINLQQGGVRPPEQVQAAFDDVLKAGQERERTKNDAQAYANNVVPLATGTASRLKEESEAYKARIVAQAQGDAGRFSAVLAEYQKAPQVTRDRMYTDAMQQIYASTTKVLVDSKQGSNLLYLPLDKLMQMSGNSGAAAATPVDAASPNVAGTAPAQSSVIPVAPATTDVRGRDGRSRDRDVR
jgi:membrane protease subunit HflK